MSASAGVTVDQCTPPDAWTALERQPDAQLIDVRTRPEWSFVGVPDLSALGKETILAEWRAFPEMQVSPDFAEAVLGSFGDQVPGDLFFICRSGARSMEAAQQIASVCAARGLETKCINVAEGFEGDLDADRHRGKLNGWKAHGLAWKQS